MSKQNPVVIYVGSEVNAQALTENTRFDGWMVLRPQDMEDALAMHIFEYPDVIVIEDSIDFGRDVFSHLRSVDEECLVLLTDQPETWSVPFGSLIRVISQDASTYELVAEIRAKLGHDDMAFAL